MPECFHKEEVLCYRFSRFEFDLAKKWKIIKVEEELYDPGDEIVVRCSKNIGEFFEHLLEEKGLAVTYINNG